MKKTSAIILFVIQFLSGVAQDCPGSIKSELAHMQHSNNTHCGVWTARLNFFEDETNGLPPHCEMYFGNHFIGDSGEKKNLFTVYGFNKNEYTNFVKLRNWEGYEVNIVDSYMRIWVIVYHNKINDPQHHEWCTKMMAFLTNYCDRSVTM